MDDSIKIVCKKCGKKLAEVEMKPQGETVVLQGRVYGESTVASDGTYWHFKCTDKRCSLSNKNAATYKAGTLNNNLKINVL